MLLNELKTFFLRDLDALERELELYPDDSSVWQEVAGLPNAGGTLILHIAGGTQHFFGAVLAGTGYVRSREAEFTRRGVPRAELRNELAAAKQALLAGFEHLSADRMAAPFPVRLGDAELSTRLTLLQLMTHLAYHLGQLDYHRRMVTGNSVSAGTLAPPEVTLP